MPIDSEFPKNHKVIGKHKNEDGRFHLVWGPGRSDAESSSHEQVQESYKTRGVDWDSCIADGACIEACPVQVFQWYRTEHDVPAAEMTNATSSGTGENHDREGRKDYTDKSDPVREHDCIWCMACVTVCPTTAIKVDEANLDVHKKMAETTS
jgi:NAD-dependent dihydropyrimidine dehydrogenase PreA subunit